jgi:heme-binding protein
MNLIATTMRRGIAGMFGACAVGAVSLIAAGTVALPVASAVPCKASGFASTASGVLASAGSYLDAHPGADDVLTASANQPEGEAQSSVRAYFAAHPNEFLDLQNIVAPIKNVRSQCGVSVTPTQLAALFEALS